MPPTYILPASRQSLFLDLRWLDNEMDNSIGTATGFVLESEGAPYLITNRHVVTGLHQITGKVLSKRGVSPTHIDVRHLASSNPREFVVKREPLYDGEAPRWIEHPRFADRADLIALPLTDTEGAVLMAHSIALRPANQTALLLPTVDVSVVGYPFGKMGGGGLAIWTRGIVASEPPLGYSDPDLGFDDLPVFLIDSRTREGQSGSPVIVQQVAGPVAMMDGSTAMLAGHTELVGIYSGRINDDSDIGMVWNLNAIRTLLSAPTG